MNSLSCGFCAGLLMGSFSENAMAQYRDTYPSPTVQVVDIQRYPSEVPLTGPSEPPRFYAAVSDSESLIWLVVPPATEMEDMISSFTVVVGCCLTLEKYTVVRAPNGYNVLLLLSFSFSPNPVSMIGCPRYDASLFPLSADALSFPLLTADRIGNEMGGSFPPSAGALSGPMGKQITLCDLLDHPECAMQPWRVTLRITWMGKARPVQNKSSRQGNAVGRGDGGYADLPPRPSEHGGQAQASRYVQQSVGVDTNGDAILCVFWLNATNSRNDGPRLPGPRHEGATDASDTPERIFNVGDCLELHRGSVLWGAGADLVPMQLQFSDRSLLKVLTRQDSEGLPWTASTFIGSLGENKHTVLDILENASVDDAVALTARVRYVDHGVYVNTKRGRVLRVIVSVEDVENPNAYIDVTFWGDLAETVAMEAGEVWYFSSCAVREFMRKKTLSTRSSTVTLRLASYSSEPMRPAGGQGVMSLSLSQTNGRSAAEQEGTLPGEQPTLPSPRLSQKVQNSKEGRAPSPICGAVSDLTSSLQLVLSLREATHTLPALVRIQEVQLPAFECRCRRCRFVQAAPDELVSSTTTHLYPCGRCHAEEAELVFAFSVILSDGCECATVRCLNQVGEALLEVTAASMATQLITGSTCVEHRLRSALVGAPVLAWIFVDACTGACTMINCSHTDLRECAKVLVTAVDELLGTS